MGIIATKNMPPISVHSGLIRQLRQRVLRNNTIQAEGRKVLVIGHPILHKQQQTLFKPLQAACEEALVVEEVLSRKHFSVTLLIRESATSILQALFAESYRILHLAGHGVYDFKAEAEGQSMSGMVLGEGIFLTPSEVAQMQTVPELVFINCCYLGVIDTGDEQSTIDLKPPLLAANLAQQFIKNGVRCVIAAGWAVDDEAGKQFARVFYQALVENQHSFGQAVRQARAFVYTEFKDFNTWGAYQCYGDPNYRLDINSASTQHTPPVTLSRQAYHFSSIQELLSDLNNQTAPFPDVIGQIPASWLNNGALLVALGKSYGLLKDYREALLYYEKSYTVDTAQVCFESVCQYAELTVDWVLSLSEATKKLPDEYAQALHRAANKLEALVTISANARYYALLGTIYRCQSLYSRAQKRIHMIDKMHECYQRACDPDLTNPSTTLNIEWLSQWMLAALVKNWRSQKNQFDVPEKLMAQGKADASMIGSCHFNDAWGRVEFDLIDQLVVNFNGTNATLMTIQDFMAADSYQHAEKILGVEQVRARLQVLVHFILEMSQNRRTKSAVYAHKHMLAFKVT
jgi:tetratricopeptide (TPR) repeat protein